VQDYSNNTFTNASQANLWFASNTPAPIARKIEAEFNRNVFTDPAFHLELDPSGLLRGTMRPVGRPMSRRWALES